MLNRQKKKWMDETFIVSDIFYSKSFKIEKINKN